MAEENVGSGTQEAFLSGHDGELGSKSMAKLFVRWADPEL